jgi:hypothetical protein
MTANRHCTFEILSEGYQREIAERMNRKPNLFLFSLMIILLLSWFVDKLYDEDQQGSKQSVGSSYIPKLLEMSCRYLRLTVWAENFLTEYQSKWAYQFYTREVGPNKQVG